LVPDSGFGYRSIHDICFTHDGRNGVFHLRKTSKLMSAPWSSAGGSVVVMSYTYARDSVDVISSAFSILLFLCLDAHNSHIWVSWEESATEWEGLSEIEKSGYYPCLVVDMLWVSCIKKKFWIALWYAMNWLWGYVSCILGWWVAEFSNYLASHFKELHVQSKWSLPIWRIHTCLNFHSHGPLKLLTI
jgi:hypothetical protein